MGQPDESQREEPGRFRNFWFYAIWFGWVPAGVYYWWVHRDDGLTWTQLMWLVPLLWSGARYTPPPRKQ